MCCRRLCDRTHVVPRHLNSFLHIVCIIPQQRMENNRKTERKTKRRIAHSENWRQLIECAYCVNTCSNSVDLCTRQPLVCENMKHWHWYRHEMFTQNVSVRVCVCLRAFSISRERLNLWIECHCEREAIKMYCNLLHARKSQ